MEIERDECGTDGRGHSGGIKAFIHRYPFNVGPTGRLAVGTISLMSHWPDPPHLLTQSGSALNDPGFFEFFEFLWVVQQIVFDGANGQMPEKKSVRNDKGKHHKTGGVEVFD